MTARFPPSHRYTHTLCIC